MYKSKHRVMNLLSWLLICTQILISAGVAAVGVLQPTPQMAQQAARQMGLGEWLAQRSGDLAAWAQPLWGQPKVALAEAGSFPLSASGTAFTCGINSNGGVQCWGDNVSGQLGDGTTPIRLTQADLVRLSSGVAIHISLITF